MALVVQPGLNSTLAAKARVGPVSVPACTMPQVAPFRPTKVSRVEPTKAPASGARLVSIWKIALRPSPKSSLPLKPISEELLDTFWVLRTSVLFLLPEAFTVSSVRSTTP